MNELIEYISGMRLCADGEECPDDASEYMIRGYSSQYELEQIQAEMTK